MAPASVILGTRLRLQNLPRTQAVRVPEEFRFKGKEVEMLRRGKDASLRKQDKTLARAFELIASIGIAFR